MMNSAGHWFWWAMTGLCLVWYSTITIYVAFKGAFDIKNMLARLDVIGNEMRAEEAREKLASDAKK